MESVPISAHPAAEMGTLIAVQATGGGFSQKQVRFAGAMWLPEGRGRCPAGRLYSLDVSGPTRTRRADLTFGWARFPSFHRHEPCFCRIAPGHRNLASGSVAPWRRVHRERQTLVRAAALRDDARGVVHVVPHAPRTGRTELGRLQQSRAGGTDGTDHAVHVFDRQWRGVRLRYVFGADAAQGPHARDSDHRVDHSCRVPVPLLLPVGRTPSAKVRNSPKANTNPRCALALVFLVWVLTRKRTHFCVPFPWRAYPFLRAIADNPAAGRTQFCGRCK